MTTVFEASYTELKQMEDRVAQLREALRKYGLHLTSCPANEGGKRCTCGLDKLINAR